MEKFFSQRKIVAIVMLAIATTYQLQIVIVRCFRPMLARVLVHLLTVYRSVEAISSLVKV